MAARIPFQLDDVPPNQIAEWNLSLKAATSLFVRVVKTIVLLAFGVWEEMAAIVQSRPRKNVYGQLALVTGAANGLGRAIALQLARNGCNVIVVDVDEKEAIYTCDALRKLGVKSWFFKTDVSVYEDVKSMLDRVEADIAPIDILVNNAGLMPLRSIRGATVADINRVMDVNVKPHFWTVKVLMDRMIARKRGHIVAVSSMAGYEAAGGLAVYSATKFAVRAFMDAIYEELRYDGLRDIVFTTTVLPFFIDTRGDVADLMIKSQKFDLLAGDYVAEQTVDGILTNQRYVALPKGMKELCSLIECLPTALKDSLRDLWKPKFRNMYHGRCTK